MVTKKDPYGGNGRALIVGEPEGMVKVICEKQPDGTAGRILGSAHSRAVGDRAARLCHWQVNWEATPE